MQKLSVIFLSILTVGCTLQVKPIDICHRPITNKPHDIQYANCLQPTTSVGFLHQGGVSAKEKS